MLYACVALKPVVCTIAFCAKSLIPAANTLTLICPLAVFAVGVTSTVYVLSLTFTNSLASPPATLSLPMSNPLTASLKLNVYCTGPLATLAPSLSLITTVGASLLMRLATC